LFLKKEKTPVGKERNDGVLLDRVSEGTVARCNNLVLMAE